MRNDKTPKDEVSEEDDEKPAFSIPEKIVVTLDELATQDDADLALILGLVDPKDDEPTVS